MGFVQRTEKSELQRQLNFHRTMLANHEKRHQEKQAEKLLVIESLQERIDEMEHAKGPRVDGGLPERIKMNY